MEGVWVWGRSFIRNRCHQGRVRPHQTIRLHWTYPLFDASQLEVGEKSSSLLKQTATEEAYSAVVVTSEKKNYNTTVLVRKNRLIEGLLPREPDGGQLERHQILRTYPLPKDPEIRVAISEPELARHGSGFFISSDIIATANHLC